MRTAAVGIELRLPVQFPRYLTEQFNKLVDLPIPENDLAKDQEREHCGYQAHSEND